MFKVAELINFVAYSVMDYLSGMIYLLNHTQLKNYVMIVRTVLLGSASIYVWSGRVYQLLQIQTMKHTFRGIEVYHRKTIIT